MVHCTKCGRQNEDSAKFCVNCGYELSPEKPKEREEDQCFGPRSREKEECFGLPYGGVIAGVVFGLFIVIIGFATLFEMDVGRFIGPLVVVIIGILIIAGAIYGLSRRPRR